MITFKEKDFFMVSKGLFQKEGLRKTDRMMYIYLSSICQDSPSHLSYAKTKKVREYFGITTPTIKSITNRLTKAELVDVDKKNPLLFELFTRENMNTEGNFFLLHYIILRSHILNANQKLIYAFLMSNARGEEMKTQIPMSKIASGCGIRDDKQLREDIKGLTELGLITQTLKRKRYMSRIQFEKYEYEMCEIPESFTLGIKDSLDSDNLIDYDSSLEDIVDAIFKEKKYG
ncbi:hypothetical protein JOC77_002975 [Peribacillus deserti]|uniref:Helix-turn-helix domain-containing protein n=1 Tax=Peribacillus deserti TaxID=673318 RepID=A0ABS2QKP7_9BACI|nr:hypothetical protein [Peribacillus deserti]MBM7693535.1 hypothetical protein [Peribacillus deserti]